MSIEHLGSIYGEPGTIKVGDVGTMCVGSDKYGFDVLWVSDNGKELKISKGHNITWRGNHKWFEKGETVQECLCVRYIFGTKITYLDPLF